MTTRTTPTLRPSPVNPADLDLIARRAHDAGVPELAKVLRSVALAYRRGRLGAVLARLHANGGRPHAVGPPKRPSGRRAGRPARADFTGGNL